MTQPLRFDGQVVIVTGGARGIGRACVELLAQRGARVLLVDVGCAPTGEPDDHLAADAAAAGVMAQFADPAAEVAPCTLDASDPAGARAIIDAAIERWGRIDAIIANAGISWSSDLGSVEPDQLDRMLAVNAAAPLWLTQAAWPHLVGGGGGRIVTVASAGLFGYPGRTHYAMSKGAVIGLTRSLALEGRKVGIVANCVLPWALTRLATGGDPDGWMGANIPPQGAAATMVRLAHDSCATSGEMFAAAGRHVARVALTVGPGAVVRDMTPESVAALDQDIMRIEPSSVPTSTGSYVNDIVRPALDTP